MQTISYPKLIFSCLYLFGFCILLLVTPDKSEHTEEMELLQLSVFNNALYLGGGFEPLFVFGFGLYSNANNDSDIKVSLSLNREHFSWGSAVKQMLNYKQS